jgi:hypothetical protein
MGATNPRPSAERFADLLAPLISFVLFGYYGFLAGLETADSSGATVPLWLGSVWILRIVTILFAATIGLALLDHPWSELAYSVAGLASTLGLLVILVWDQLDTANRTAFHPLLLVVFILWNGFGSISSLRRAMA